jgi:Methyl-accepting chemotaxis protein-like, first PDC sensor domain
MCNSSNNGRCCDFWDWLSTFKLRNQFMCLLSVPLLICIILTVVINIVILHQTSSKIQDDGTAAMTQQNARITTNAIAEQSTLLTTRLNFYDSGVVTLLRENFIKAATSSYPFDAGETYYSFDPLPPLTAHLGTVASFGASSFYLPGISTGSVGSFTTAINKTRDDSWHLERLMKEIMTNNPLIVGLYIGFEANGEFRIFPGQQTPNAYDPRVRGWYTCAMSSTRMCITEPYQDALSKQWMITFAVRYVDSGGVTIGVFGADVLINGIRESISDLTFYDSGKATLFQTSGAVVADRECGMSIADETVCRYQSLESPIVSDGIWNTISSLTAGSSTTIDTGSHLITASRSEEWSQYILVVFIPKGSVTAPMVAVRSEISSTRTSITTSLIIVLAVTVVVSIGFTWLMAHCVARPVDKTKEMFENMQQQIGTGHRLNEIERVQGGMGAEGTELADNANSWLQRVIDGGSAVVNTGFAALLPTYEQAILSDFSSGSGTSERSSYGAGSSCEEHQSSTTDTTGTTTSTSTSTSRHAWADTSITSYNT